MTDVRSGIKHENATGIFIRKKVNPGPGYCDHLIWESRDWTVKTCCKEFPPGRTFRDTPGRFPAPYSLPRSEYSDHHISPCEQRGFPVSAGPLSRTNCPEILSRTSRIQPGWTARTCRSWQFPHFPTET